MDLLDRVRATVDRYDLIGARSRTLVALSGGPDSVALTWLLRALETSGRGRLVGLAHLDHGLRPESSEDAEFCRALAARLTLPIAIESGDVRAHARRARQSIEAAAHDARYEFLRRTARELGADRIALGHTRDDQAETVLLRLLRGAGPRGLAGMHPRVGSFVRPLLECRRAEIREFLAARHEPFVVDSTNLDVSIPRNRVRVELMPLLEQRFNPRAVDALADMAEIARADWQWLESQAATLLETAALRSDAGGVRLVAGALAAAPLAVARVAVLRAIARSGVRPGAGRRHVDQVLDLARSARGAIDLPGLRAKRSGPNLVLIPSEQPGRPSDVGASSFSYPLPVPGEVAVREAACTISAEPHPLGGPSCASPGRTQALVALAADSGRLIVRNRHPGDRFRPFGLNGRKKLQDFFVDLKVPRQIRDRVPLVVDERNRIVWVAGYAASADFRVTTPAQAVIMLTLSPWGGPA